MFQLTEKSHFSIGALSAFVTRCCQHKEHQGTDSRACGAVWIQAIEYMMQHVSC